MTSDPSWTPFDPEGEILPGTLSLPGGGGDSPMVVLLAGTSEEESGWAPRAALGLARGWARAGLRVVLADLGLEAPALHALLGEENGEGITDALLYGSSVQRIARRPRGEKFALIPAGTPVSDPAGVLAHPRWGSLATGFREAGVILAIYLPAALPGADALARRVSLRVILGPGGEALGTAPILARLRPIGAEPGLPFVPEDEPFAGGGEDVAAAAADDGARTVIPSVPASRLTPAPVPALHRWVGVTDSSAPGGTLTADLPEDFSPGFVASRVPAEAPEESTAEVASPDPFDFLTLTPASDSTEMVSGAGSPAGPVEEPELSDMDAPGLWTPLETTTPIPVGEEGPGERGVEPEPVAPSSSLPLTPGRPPASSPAVPTPRVQPPPPPPRRRSPLGLLLLLLLLLLAVLGAARLGILSIPGVTPSDDAGPGRTPGTSTAEAAVLPPGAAEVADDSSEAPAEPMTFSSPSAHTLALALNAYTTASGARAAAERVRAALPGHPVVIAPVEVSGRIFHRLLVTGATDPAAVASLRQEVAPAFPQGNPAEWIVRDADRGFLLGEEATVAGARERAAALEARGIPTYLLEIQLSDGSRRWRVHAGAYGSEDEASALSALLREAGEGTAPLVPLVGRPPA
jgi:hypothetical protein